MRYGDDVLVCPCLPAQTLAKGEVPRNGSVPPGSG